MSPKNSSIPKKKSRNALVSLLYSTYHLYFGAWMALLLIQIDELEQIFDEVALAGGKKAVFLLSKNLSK